MKLPSLLDTLESKIPFQDKINLPVSSASVGWHIEHILLTIDAIIKRMESSEDTNYKWRFSLLRYYILLTKRIPRGKGQSPAHVRPKTALHPDMLRDHLESTRQIIGSLDGLSSNKYFEHPIFGHLNAKPAGKFLDIHTVHHLKIIQDILK